LRKCYTLAIFWDHFIFCIILQSYQLLWHRLFYLSVYFIYFTLFFNNISCLQIFYSPWPQSAPLFSTRKTLEKWDTLGTFTQKVPFLDYNKGKKWDTFGWDTLESWTVLWIYTHIWENKKNPKKVLHVGKVLRFGVWWKILRPVAVSL